MCSHGLRVLECSRTPQSEERVMRYGNLSGVLSRDNALNSGLGVVPGPAEV